MINLGEGFDFKKRLYLYLPKNIIVGGRDVVVNQLCEDNEDWLFICLVVDTYTINLHHNQAVFLANCITDYFDMGRHCDIIFKEGCTGVKKVGFYFDSNEMEIRVVRDGKDGYVLALSRRQALLLKSALDSLTLLRDMHQVENV